MSSLLLKSEITEKTVASKRSTTNRFIKNWYVFYTYSNAEKSIYSELLKRNYEAFLPTQKILKLWMNRQKKWVCQIVFPNYIFVYTQQNELHNITRIPRIVSYVCSGGSPSIIASNEIEGIRKMLQMNQDITIENKFLKGERVKINCGPLIGHEGILVKQKGKSRFGILLKEINQTALIEVPSFMLEKA